MTAVQLLFYCFSERFVVVTGKCVSDGIRWNVTYDGWRVLAGEIHLLLSQVSYGSGCGAYAELHKVMFDKGPEEKWPPIEFIHARIS